MKFSVYLTALFVAGIQAAPAPADERCLEPNKVYKECGSDCPPTCDQPVPGNCNTICIPGCFCVDGFLQNEAGGCVTPDKC
ncbi:hypothetical protein FDECE_6920 [Fusarium decemcellulare]|nr:hypothetical protein FDECE_6920 [Fusarium decemcellulare]